MDRARRKELLAAYQDRRPEMGVISLRCEATGESFLGVSTDTRAGFNSIRAKLAGGRHPNRRLQALWDQYGPEGFTCAVLRTLPYDDPRKDQSRKLEALRAECLEKDPKAGKLWR